MKTDNMERLADLIYWMLIALVAGSLFSLIWAKFFQPYDDTDPPRGWGRSGLRVYTDNLTGCQYLAPPGGDLTPRLAGRGLNQVGCKMTTLGGNDQ